MQTKEANYISIESGTHFFEYRFSISGTVYSQSDMVGVPVITAALFEKFSIGNCVAKSLEMDIRPKSVIPKMAAIVAEFRICNSTSQSSWHPKGTFYIDTRKLADDGTLHIVAYDAMLKSGYVYFPEGEWASKTAKAVVSDIATHMGIDVNAATLSMMQSDQWSIDYVPVVGPDGTQGREMLADIATYYGGNFIVDDYDELRFVGL